MVKNQFQISIKVEKTIEKNTLNTSIGEYLATNVIIHYNSCIDTL